ncbi:unnamed protein product [Adineta steineri]|uniref:Aminoglycoside phosphotransferase domain-containing protein n=1 Tax=Adineta steineri TaxID=433720 RepID=A0A815KIK2_9BILA|nr:unnamed protein product [Adineta steineri]CAF1393375.1 unnamed protein product [Adineta steineri]
MEDRIVNILTNNYSLTIDKLIVLEGGYYPDETYLLITTNKIEYIIKYIVYCHSFEYLESILKFQNILHDLYEYPCAQIILSKNEQILLKDNNRLFFVQTFIRGIEPTKEILDKDDNYLYHMGYLLGQWRLASKNYLSNNNIKQECEEFTNQWWEKQNISTVDDTFLLSNLFECKQKLINLNETFERGLIHNDFHTNNSIVRNDQKIFIIDFVDACQSVFIADLATSLFHLLIDQQNGKHRAKLFLNGYQQKVQLSIEEINILDILVRLKLTMSIIEDLHNLDDPNDSFIQSCFHLLHTLKNDSTLVKNLI